jgi:large repetitive protein
MRRCGWLRYVGGPRRTRFVTGILLMALLVVFVQPLAASKHTATRAFTLSAYQVVGITTASLPAGLAGDAYSEKLAATGVPAPQEWMLTSGALPRGLSLAATGRISGTPAAVGHTQFTVQVTDEAKPAGTARKTFTLFVTGPALPAGGVRPQPGQLQPCPAARRQPGDLRPEWTGLGDLHSGARNAHRGPGTERGLDVAVAERPVHAGHADRRQPGDLRPERSALGE